MSTEMIACAHVSCQCVVSAQMDELTSDPLPAYCSDLCREMEDVEEDLAESCACGHPACDSP